MEPKAAELWCCYSPDGYPLYRDTLQYTRRESQEALCEFLPNGSWKALYRMGFRCIRVSVTPSPSAR